MYELGVPPGDALELLEYGELDWFFPRLLNRSERIETKKKLEMLEVFAIANTLGTKKGHENYKRYHRKLVNRYNSLIERRTFFDELKRNSKRTMFDELKEMKNGV